MINGTPDQLRKIRQRASYERFKRIAEAIQKQGVAAGIREIDNIMNGMHAYGSNKQAIYAAESVELLIQDMQLDRP